MSIIDDIINNKQEVIRGPNRNKRANYKTSSFDAYRADKQVKYCTKCKKCWELDTTAVRNLKGQKKGTQLLNHYPNFPSYGKKRKTCLVCKGDYNGRLN